MQLRLGMWCLTCIGASIVKSCALPLLKSAYRVSLVSRISALQIRLFLGPICMCSLPLSILQIIRLLLSPAYTLVRRVVAFRMAMALYRVNSPRVFVVATW